ncbi:transcription factor 7-like 1-B [Sparus aurata]|uniref:transcription factor 7-like 1-B n=1 Tax=Sparus aurata TaxID=8175 RepID=UPI0011C0D17B|nr:transcription factor 7-like 1-B [Sparus aurata]
MEIFEKIAKYKHYVSDKLLLFGAVSPLKQQLLCCLCSNGEPVFTLPAGVFPPSVPAAPQLNTSNSQERKCESEQEDDRLYIKRPPNAFMLSIKEHRPHVEEDVKMMGNGAVNMVLGQRWKSLSAEERAVYYQQAQREKELHAQQHPGWSVRQNYHLRGRVCYLWHPPHWQL